MSWLARGSLSLLPQLFKALSKQNGTGMGGALYDSYFGGDAIRFGMFVATYFTTFKAVDKLLQRWGRGGRYRTMLAGAVATLPGYLLVGREIGASLGSYLIFRAMHSLVLHHYKKRVPSKKGWEEWIVRHGNLILFSLSVGQLMYCFIMVPGILDPGYSSYLTRVAYMHPYIKQATQNIEHQLPVDFDKLSQIAGQEVSGLFCGHLVPCACMHPGQSHVGRIVRLFAWNFRDVLPVYAGLYAVPQMLVKGLGMFERDNMNHLVVNVTRSSSFISAIIALYQTMFCLQRTLIPIKHRLKTF